jgi:hypothetical protein
MFTIFIDYIKSGIETAKTFYNGYCKFIIDLVGIYLLWIVLHFAASHAYTTWCVPFTVFGLIISPFVAPSPHCNAFRWIINTGGNNITAMWIILGTWFARKVLIP